MQTNNKLREALTKILNLTNSLDEDCAVDPVEIRDIANAALAEPVKNCDVGTAEEQAERYARHCDANLRDDGGNPCTNCPCCGKIPFGKCEFAWAQMPYEADEKGEANDANG